MTGLEIAAAGKALKSATELVVGEEVTVKDQLRELAKDSPAMRAAANNYAARIAVKQKILLQAYRPLARLIGVSREYFDTSFHIELAEKTAGIPDEELSTPLASVAIPAMQGLSYSLDEPSLKDMYLNLLAAATDKRRHAEAHPSFAEIIKQLSSAEVDALDHVLRQEELPVVQIRAAAKTGNGYRVMNWIDLEQGIPIEFDLSAFLDNWVRLGLIRISYTSKLAGEGLYDWASLRPEYVRLVAEGHAVTAVEGRLGVTSFGKRFALAVRTPVDAKQAPIN
jgi:Abortive infection alpha